MSAVQNAGRNSKIVDTSLMRLLAANLAEGITTGADWPNSNDELLRLQSAELLRRAADELELWRQRD